MSHQYEILSFMLIEAARRAETAAKEMLALVNVGAASCSEMREMLAVSKATMTIMAAAQVGAAAVIARSERHGDGGTQVLADSAVLSRRDAHSQVKTANMANMIEAAPAARRGGVRPDTARQRQATR